MSAALRAAAPFAIAIATACVRTAPSDAPARARATTPRDAATDPIDPARVGDATADGDARLLHVDADDAATDAAVHARVDGPHLLALTPDRPIYYAFPAEPERRPARLVAHFHGMCGPPSYACGKWLGAGVDVGAVICPTGNARCGDSPVGPPSWEAPSWQELVVAMDKDLETSIARVDAKHPRAFRRDGEVLTGYSRGAYAVPVIAGMHPGRWPYLVMIEADATLTAAGLKRAGVHAVALVAGEQGTEIAGMRKTAEQLDRDGFPARLFVMPKTGHLYSEDMEEVMRSALAFVLASRDGG